MKPVSPSRTLALGATGLALLLTTACGTGGPAPESTTVTTTATAASTATAPPGSPPPTVTSPAPTSPDPTTFTTVPILQCETSDLAVGIAGQQGAAGSVIIDLDFRNTGPRPCTLEGFPGVSLIDDTGEQIGTAAVREGAAGQSVVLGIGGRAAASVRIARAENFDAADCVLVPATALRVYPPGNTAAVDLPLDSLSGCAGGGADLLSVKALTQVPFPD